MKMEILTIILAGLAIITYGISFIKGILHIRKSVDEPNIKQDKEIALIKKDIITINRDIHDIKVNHLAHHIEENVFKLQEGQIRIETLLNK